jgi:hypothetical protein
MKEKWKDIPGYEGFYKISSFGRILSVPKGRCKHCGYGGKKGGITLGSKSNGIKRYRMVSLSKPDFKGQKARLVHRLVAEVFVPNPKNLRFVNHKDLDIYNNNADNLEWMTPSQNAQHAIKNGHSCWNNPKRVFVNPWPTRRANAARKAQQLTSSRV